MNVFVYGTLLFPEIFAAVSGQQLQPHEAVLPGHRREGVRGEPYPAIIPDPESSVRGRVYRGLSRAGLARLDAFEGHEYLRRVRRVRLLEPPVGRGDSLAAACYVIAPGLAHRLDGRPWDPETFAARHLAHYRRRCRPRRRTHC